MKISEILWSDSFTAHGLFWSPLESLASSRVLAHTTGSICWMNESSQRPLCQGLLLWASSLLWGVTADGERNQKTSRDKVAAQQGPRMTTCSWWTKSHEAARTLAFTDCGGTIGWFRGQGWSCAKKAFAMAVFLVLDLGLVVLVLVGGRGRPTSNEIRGNLKRVSPIV